MQFFWPKRPKISSKLHYLFLLLIFLKSTIKKQSNSPDMILLTHHWELMKRIQTLTSPCHMPKHQKNNFFRTWPNHFKFSLKFEEKCPELTPIKIFLLLPFPSTPKLQKTKKYFAIFGQNNAIFLTKKAENFVKIALSLFAINFV